MSRKKKRNWWWGKEDDSEINQDLFGNSISQHNKKIYGKDKDIYTYEEDDYIESPYQFDWGLDRKLNEGVVDTKDKVKSYEYTRDEFRSGYGGDWKGYEYYKVQQLSYKYVQQMANVLAAQHKITVKVGNTWDVDLKKRILTYNPASLVYGTKSELLATLMHEIGKLRFGTHPDEVKNNYLAVYGVPVVEVLSIFEDIRVDYWMLKGYPGATEIYESAIPAIDKKVKEYREVSKVFRQIVMVTIQQLFEDIIAKSKSGQPIDMSNQGTIYGTNPSPNIQAQLEQNLQKVFGEKDPMEVMKKIQALQDEYRDSGSVYDYCGEMLRVMYDSDSDESGFKNIKEKVALTEKAIEKAKKLDSTQKNADMLTTEVFPFVEDLFRDFNRDNEKIKNAFPNMPDIVSDHLAKRVQEELNRQTKGNDGRVNTNRSGNSSVRTSGPTEDVIPKEWLEGDYQPIKESVMPEIKSLISKLTFLRREEMAQKHQSGQRRGKLNARQLYKSATGNRRVFKRILPNTNTVQSFAFSILVDTSGSMSGKRMVHTTRGLAIFTEVFKKMDIPFEIIRFSNGATVVKSFDDQVDKAVQKKIGGMADRADGGTNLHTALDKMELEKQPEKNKVCIVLSDGGVGDIKGYDREYFEPMAKRGVKSVGFGIECEQQMAQLCMGNSKVLDNASTLPTEFANLLKSLIKRKK